MMAIMIMGEVGYISRLEQMLYTRINSICRILFIAWGTILSIRNDIKAGKKIRFLQKAALVYCTVSGAGLLVSIMMTIWGGNKI